MAEILSSITSLDFWLRLFERYAAIGPIAPVALAMLESLIPPLPLIAIVTLNVAACGPLWGFLYSWAGTCAGCTIVFSVFRLALRGAAVKADERWPRGAQARKWVGGISAPAIFIILVMPFTPSAFMNFAFGLSDCPAGKYLVTLCLAKLVMIGSLALFGQSTVYAAEDRRFIFASAALLLVLILVSRRVRKRHDL